MSEATDQTESSTMRTARAAVTLYRHAVLCDETHQYQTARVMWAKYAEAARKVERGTNLMKNTGRRLC